MTQAEYITAKKQKYQEYKAGLITNYAYIQWKKKNDPSLPGNSAANSVTASAGMTHQEYIGLWEALKKKNKAGLITKSEYHELGVKLDQAYKDKKTVSEIEKEIGCDPGTLATDDAVIKLGRKFKRIYGEAAQDMQTKLDDFLKKYGPEMKELEKKFIDGTITQEELAWQKNKLLQQKIMQQKIDQLTGVMTNANKKALAEVNGDTLGVFADNANWQSYQISKDANMDLMFSIYDENTVKRLIDANPELLPRKEVDGKKDAAWNRKIISNSLTQGIIQGDSIPALTRRISRDTGEKNSKAMMRYARTAMTCAQNGGRIEMLHNAQAMGIKCKKRWLATLDSRTRDSHQQMDGVSIGVDEEFKTPLGSKMQYPGDPSGKGGDVWNCRCTLVYDYEGFPNDPTADLRRDNETGEEIANMDYSEWKAAKESSVLNSLSNAKLELAAVQKEFVQKGVNESKVYEGIWKDPVTLADYPAKAASIQAKRDYYTSEIQKYKNAQAMGASWATDEKIKDLQKRLRLLNEFERNGKLLQKRNAALKKVQDLYGQAGIGKAASAPEVAKKAKKAAQKAAPASGGTNTGDASQAGQTGAQAAKKALFGPEDYTKERKDKALWTTNKKKVDSMMRDRTGEVWKKATQAERDAIYDYTTSYSKFNEPLRGIEYGTSAFKGVGKTDLNAGRKRNGSQLNAMTDIIEKCSYDHDMWLQRGCRWGGMDKFLQCDMSLLQNGTQKQLEGELLGKTITEFGFMSMGSAKGQGFSGDILFNIYAPAGTKMMYAEPFSAYGHGAKSAHWDGGSTQSSFGREFETIMQQNTQFRVTKVEKSGRQIYIDIEVIGQSEPQRWGGR